MRRRALARWTVAPVVIALALTGCSSSGSNKGSKESKASVDLAEPKHLIPSNTTESAGSQVLAALFSPLVDFGADNKPYPVAAESVESADKKLWTIKLKDGYTFHNGEKVTAQSYIDAWNYGAYGPNGQDGNGFFARIQGYDAMNPPDPDGDGPKTAPKPTVDKLSGLKKIDDLTFQVVLTAPFSAFESVLGYTTFYPMPTVAFANIKAYEQAPIGNGAFKMKGVWEHDKQLTVEQYDKFPGTKPKIKTVVFRIYQQLSTAYQDLVAGNLDVLKTIPTEDLVNAKSDLGDRFLNSPASSFQFVAFPTYDPKFKNPNVRKAISMAIDRDEIIKTIFKNSQTSARAFVSPVVPGFREDTCGDACKFDPTAAKAMLAAAGGLAGNSMIITYNDDGGHKEWVDATCNQLKTNLGIGCAGKPEPKFADLLEKVQRKQPVGVFRLGWVMDYPSMENYLGPLYSCKGSSNYYGYCNQAFDALVREGDQAATLDAGIKIYQQAEDLLAKDMPVIPLRFGQNNYGHSERVKNVKVDLFDRVDLIDLELA